MKYPCCSLRCQNESVCWSKEMTVAWKIALGDFRDLLVFASSSSSRCHFFLSSWKMLADHNVSSIWFIFKVTARSNARRTFLFSKWTTCRTLGIQHWKIRADVHLCLNTHNSFSCSIGVKSLSYIFSRVRNRGRSPRDNIIVSANLCAVVGSLLSGLATSRS